MKILSSLLFTFAILPIVQAEVITDGSLGAKVELTGKDFQIMPELGQQFGGNLFHSFQSFNLNADESATFSGSNTVQNIISRVTGGSPSHLDGLIRSTIPNADLYFINPYGVMFGQNAKLDLQGGFHVSTADYLKLQDGGRFDARNPSNSLLSVAPVSAFGFLTDTPASITLQDSHLAVSKGKTLSWLGGDLQLTGTQPYAMDKTGLLTFSAELLAPSGRINLASIAAPGEIIPSDSDLTLTGKVRQGLIHVQHATIDTGESRGGNIFIRGGSFELTGSMLSSQTSGEQNGGMIDLQVEQLKLWQGSQVSASTFGAGHAGSVNVLADTVEISGTHQTGELSNISSSSLMTNSGDAGNLVIKTRQMNLSHWGALVISTAGTGQGGLMTLKVAEDLNLTKAGIIANAYGTMPDAGDAGDLMIQAGRVTLTDGGQINSFARGVGQGGTIQLQVADTLTAIGTNSMGYSSAIGATSTHKELEHAGNAGNIEITARHIVLQDGGRIDSGTWGTGQGGTMYLQVSDTLTVTGQDASGRSSGIYASSHSQDKIKQAGQAGSLFIQAHAIHLLDGGKISTQTNDAGGGNVTLLVSHQLYLQQAQVTTSVKGGTGDGGNLTLSQPDFIVLNHGQIKAQADAGRGGNIAITAEHFISSAESIVSASSNLGIDGQVVIQSPTEDIGNQVLSLSANFLNASSLLLRSCAVKLADQRLSQFVHPFALTVKSKEIIAAPEDVRASYSLPIKSGKLSNK